ncbi:uncharacterized oxidoreductase Mflv_4205-like [Leptopilina boulardi]|uniref:uncharacterized oxidoreductase Mflv_4205-like n=1 Tax=Leptopilina boulardi TaxID=63433 RepID=UPI0021F5F0C7|nr:uncharacterized oxidoreductase Mflv_4205-like [Leptopilina boulardi]
MFLHKESTLKLRYNEMKIPIIGYDTTFHFMCVKKYFLNEDEQVKAALSEAIDAGYRLIFCDPRVKGNERAVGEALKEKLEEKKVQREELFIVTKVYLSHTTGFVEESIKKSLEALQLDYVDMLLLFCPVDSDTKPYGPDYTEAWRGMQNSYYKKYAKSLGLCNFTSNKIECILKIATVKPSANLMNCNVFMNCKDLRKYLKKHKIVLLTNNLYGSVGIASIDPGRESPDKVHLNQLVPIKELSEKYNKTNCQIAIRYLLEIEAVPLVKSGFDSSIRANIDVFDFNLDKSEMKMLNAIDDGNYDPSLKLYNKYPEDYAYIDLSNLKI